MTYAIKDYKDKYPKLYDRVKEIAFKNEVDIEDFNDGNARLGDIFYWGDSVEGFNFWNNIDYFLLGDKEKPQNHNGLLDEVDSPIKLRSVKFRSHSEEHARQFLKLAFDSGAEWRSGGKESKYLESGYFFIGENGLISITSDDYDFFCDHKNKEIFLENGKLYDHPLPDVHDSKRLHDQNEAATKSVDKMADWIEQMREDQRKLITDCGNHEGELEFVGIKSRFTEGDENTAMIARDGPELPDAGDDDPEEDEEGFPLAALSGDAYVGPLGIIDSLRSK